MRCLRNRSFVLVRSLAADFKMPQLKLLCLILASLSLALVVEATDIQTALDRALSFLKGQRDARTRAWKPKESAPAMLGIFSGDPTWRDRGNNGGNGEKEADCEVVSTIQGTELMLLELLGGYR